MGRAFDKKNYNPLEIEQARIALGNLQGWDKGKIKTEMLAEVETYFVAFHKNATEQEKREIISNYKQYLEGQKDLPWRQAALAILEAPLVARDTLALNGIAEKLAPVSSSERNYVFTMLDKIDKNLIEPLKALIVKAEKETLPLKKLYNYATKGHGRTHENEVLPSEKFKAMYSDAKGDQLKTQILKDFKESIDSVTTPEELNTIKKQLENDEGYQTLATRQGANWLNYVPFLKTDSVKALDSMIKEAEERIAHTEKSSSKP